MCSIRYMLGCHNVYFYILSINLDCGKKNEEKLLYCPEQPDSDVLIS